MNTKEIKQLKELILKVFNNFIEDCEIL